MGVGILGTKVDVERFTEIIAADFNVRCHRAADKVFKGRIQLVPGDAELPEDDEVQ